MLFIERDLGTERGEILPGKVRAGSRHSANTDAAVLTAGCLADPDTLAAFDDRAAQAMSVLRPHLR